MKIHEHQRTSTKINEHLRKSMQSNENQIHENEWKSMKFHYKLKNRWKPMTINENRRKSKKILFVWVLAFLNQCFLNQCCGCNSRESACEQLASSWSPARLEGCVRAASRTFPAAAVDSGGCCGFGGLPWLRLKNSENAFFRIPSTSSGHDFGKCLRF